MIGCRALNPEGVAAFSPGLNAEGGLPWVNVITRVVQPQGGCSRVMAHTAATPLGLNNQIFRFFPG